MSRPYSELQEREEDWKVIVDYFWDGDGQAF